MKINCNIADDLLPLYLEESCSPDSKAALEEHLKQCSTCRDKLDKLQNTAFVSQTKSKINAPQLVDYAKKVKQHRTRMTILIVAVTIFAAIILALGYLTILDMHKTANPVITEIEAGTYNLIGNELATAVEDLDQYIFYTNTTQMTVSVQGEGEFQGLVMLWNTTNSEDYIMSAEVSEGKSSCTFTNLSAANRYKISCDGLEGLNVIITENRKASFWKSLQSVINELFTW